MVCDKSVKKEVPLFRLRPDTRGLENTICLLVYSFSDIGVIEAIAQEIVLAEFIALRSQLPIASMAIIFIGFETAHIRRRRR